MIILFLKVTFADTQDYKYLDEVNKKIITKDCAGAESYARRFIQPPILFTVIGLVKLDCLGDKRSSIEYLKIAARENETIAIEKLIALGESPPPVMRPSVKNPEMNLLALPAPPPMPPIIFPPQASPQVIIQQQAPVMLPNPAACIQDGGGTFCPNHPNSAYKPFKF